MTDQPEQYTARVPDELAGQRLDQALARMFPDYSRSRLKEWLLDGAIRVEGGPKRPKDAVAGGERVAMEVGAAADRSVEPITWPLGIPPPASSAMATRGQ